MVKLHNQKTHEFLGRIDRDQLQFLVDHLEEESREDCDYCIRKETLDTFDCSGADPKLVEIRRAAMKPENAVEVRWEDEYGGCGSDPLLWKRKVRRSCRGRREIYCLRAPSEIKPVSCKRGAG